MSIGIFDRNSHDNIEEGIASEDQQGLWHKILNPLAVWSKPEVGLRPWHIDGMRVTQPLEVISSGMKYRLPIILLLMSEPQAAIRPATQRVDLPGMPSMPEGMRTRKLLTRVQEKFLR